MNLRVPGQSRNPASKNIYIYSYTYVFFSKFKSLRTRIDLQRLMRNHVSSCVFLVKGRQDLHRDMRTWVILVWVSVFLSAEVEPGPCTLSNGSSCSTS